MSDVVIAGRSVAAGKSALVSLPVASLYTHNDLAIDVQVVRGKRPGPTLFVCAAVHGDEINGVEIVRRLLQHRSLKSLRGTLLAIPIVNVHGFLHNDRYLPDGRDLNRSFPGSPKGSLSGRVAHTFLREIVLHCSHGIDLHTGARHRGNLPQIRADMNNEDSRAMAEAFGVPVVLHSRVRDGSLREVANDNGIPVLTYEAGEALRFDELAIRAGVNGVIKVMRHIGMLSPSKRKRKEPMITDQSLWVRAPESGILRALVPLGARVAKGNVIAMISDPIGSKSAEVTAPDDGIIIGRTFLPLVHEGEALFHLAKYKKHTDKVFSQVEQFHAEHGPDNSLEPPDSVDEAPIV